MNPLQYMILLLCAGQVMAPGFQYKGSSDLEIITKQYYSKKDEPDETHCLYSSTTGDIFLKDNKKKYKVLNLKLKYIKDYGSQLVQEPVEKKNLLPIYYKSIYTYYFMNREISRLGLILEKVEDGSSAVNNQVKPEKSINSPVSQAESKQNGNQGSTAITHTKEYILAFQKTEQENGVYKFDYHPKFLSQEDLTQISQYSQNPKGKGFGILGETAQAESKTEQTQSKVKFVFNLDKFSYFKGSTYYLSLEFPKENFLSAPPTRTNF